MQKDTDVQVHPTHIPLLGIIVLLPHSLLQIQVMQLLSLLILIHMLEPVFCQARRFSFSPEKQT